MPCKNSDYHKKWYQINRERILKIQREYKKNNREKIRLAGKIYRKEHLQQSTERMRRWRYYNPERSIDYSHRYYERVKPHHSEICKKWKVEHPEEVRVHRHRSNFNRRLKFPIGVTKESEAEIKRRDRGKCIYCARSIDETLPRYVPTKSTEDHIDSKGGSTIDNLALSCWECNQSKGNKDVLIWTKEKFPKRYNRIVNKINRIKKLKSVI